MKGSHKIKSVPNRHSWSTEVRDSFLLPFSKTVVTSFPSLPPVVSLKGTTISFLPFCCFSPTWKQERPRRRRLRGRNGGT